MTPESFFADALLPLRQARARRGLAWLDLAPDPSRGSYWEAPLSRTGGMEHLPIGEADGAAMLQRLVAWWEAEGEAWLASLAPDLEALRTTLAAGDGEAATPAPRLSYSAYPLF